LRPLHQVDARLGRQRVQFGLQLLAYIHAHILAQAAYWVNYTGIGSCRDGQGEYNHHGTAYYH
jgi:hypothetical protein